MVDLDRMRFGQARCQCAVPDCVSFLRWEGSELDTRMLALNGWVEDHGKWICPHHDGATTFPRRTPKTAQSRGVLGPEQP